MNFTSTDAERIDWDKGGGLVPAVIQHAQRGTVLMLGYMTRDSLRATLERRRVVFFSRAKQRLWEKGESSGHYLDLIDIRLDCDADTLLVSALPNGPVCHTGTASCFGDAAATAAESLAFLAELQTVIASRFAAGPEGSYTAKLHAQGVRRIAQKVGEEGLEVALAGAGEGDEQLIGESADLLFHLLVLLQERGLDLARVVETLRQRHSARPAQR